jgi:hypothetical protein
MRRKSDVTFAANPEIYYQDFFPTWNKITTKQNAFKFKIAPHKQKSIVKICWQEDEAPLANEVLCGIETKLLGVSDYWQKKSWRWIHAYVVQF